MKTFVVIVFLSTFIFSQNNDNASTIFHTPDGQFSGSPFKVFINIDITEDQQPKLQLLPHGFTSKIINCEDDIFCFEPYRVGRSHSMTLTRDGITTNEKGTLLIFDISKFEFSSFQAIKQVLPILTINESDTSTKTKNIIDNEEVYVANSSWVVGYTVLIVSVILLFFFVISQKVNLKVKNVLCGSHGRLSLSQTQVALWTIFIGAFVFAFGLIRLEIPTIPNSLIALMGISLATGSLKHFSTKSEDQASVADREGNIPTNQDEIAKKNNSFIPKKSWVNLISVFDRQAQGYRLSIAKAQMLFWTVLSISLFVAKSISNDVLWEVPWELVALMGISQSAYLLPSLKNEQTQSNNSMINQAKTEQENTATPKQ